MSIGKVSKRVIRVTISASIQSFADEFKQKAQRHANSNLNGFAYHFYDDEARWSMARRNLSLSQKKEPKVP